MAATSDKAEKKVKAKKKWSIRSISCTRKNKSKSNVSIKDSKSSDYAKEELAPKIVDGGGSHYKSCSCC